MHTGSVDERQFLNNVHRIAEALEKIAKALKPERRETLTHRIAEALEQENPTGLVLGERERAVIRTILEEEKA